MRKIALAIAALTLFVAFSASAQTVRYFVNDTDDVIEILTEHDSVSTPTGYTAVNKSVVDAACSCESQMNGTWDGTTYAEPEGRFDTSTDAGQLKAAVVALHAQLENWSTNLIAVASFWPEQDVELGHNLLAYAHRGVRGVVLSTSWTTTQKLTFMEQMAYGAADVTSPAEFFELMEEGRIAGGDSVVPDPTVGNENRVIWVNPDTGLRVNLSQWDSGARSYDPGNGDGTVVSRMAAETTDLHDYIDAAWIEDIQ